jgi:hypothetical protein
VDQNNLQQTFKLVSKQLQGAPNTVVTMLMNMQNICGIPQRRAHGVTSSAAEAPHPGAAQVWNARQLAKSCSLG